MGRELGRISGPLLAENLLRNGNNLAFESKLLYLDVVNGYVGIDTATPTRTLLVNVKADTTNLIVDTLATIANLEVSTNQIQNVSGGITFRPFQSATPTVTAPNFQAGNIKFSSNSFSNVINNADIILDPAGTGRVIFNSSRVNVDGDLHATGNITWDGNITLGDNASQDTVTFAANVNSNILPTTTNTYDLGQPLLTWATAYVDTTNATITGAVDLNTTEFTGSGTNNLNGNVIIGASNANRLTVTAKINSDLVPLVTDTYRIGSKSPLLYWNNVYGVTFNNGNITLTSDTIQTNATNSNLRLVGFGSGSVIFSKLAVTNSNNVTIGGTLNVSGTTSLNNNVSSGAITQTGSYNITGNATLGTVNSGNITAENPLTLPTVTINNSVITGTASGSNLILTANTGQTVEVTSTAKFNNNVSIGGTLGVTGATTFSNNVSSGAITQTGSYNLTGNATLGIVNSGNITAANPFTLANMTLTGSVITGTANSNLILTPNTGQQVKVTSNAVVDQNLTVGNPSGSLTVSGTTTFSNNVSSGAITQTGSYNLTGNTSITGAITNVSGTATFANNIQFISNTVQTTVTNSDLQLVPNGTGKVIVPTNNVEITNNLTVGLVTTTGVVTVTPPGVATATTFNLADAYFTDNYFNTTTTDRNLELRANGTGKVQVPSKNVEITNDLTVNGATNLKNVIIGATGNAKTLTLTGNYTQTGAANRIGNTSILGATKHLTVSSIGEFSSTIQLNSNTLQTIATNTNLVFSANGFGKVIVPTNNVVITNNLIVNGAATTQAVTVTNTAQATTFKASDAYFTDNYFNTTTTNRNLELRANGTGIIKVLNNNVELGNGLTVNGTTSLKTTTITGTETITGDVTQIATSPANLVISMGGTQVFQSASNKLGGSVGATYPFVNAINSGQVPVGSQIFVKWSLHPVTVYMGTVTGYVNFNTAQSEILVSNPLNFTLPTYDASANVNYVAQTVTVNNGLAYRVGNTNITGNLTTSSYAQFQNIRIDSNVLSTTATNSDLILFCAPISNGKIIVPTSNVEITNDLRVLGNTYLKGTIVVGTATAGTFTTGDAYYTSNYFNTTLTNSNLELRANGTGRVQVPLKDVEITNNLTVSAGNTSVRNTVIGSVGNAKLLTLTGNKTQTGAYNQTGNANISGTLTVTASGLFPQVSIIDNVISGTTSNTDVQLKAAGTGRIFIPLDNVRFNQTLTVGGTTDTVNINSSGTVTANKFKTSEITIENNSITTVNGNTNLLINALGTGKVGLEKIYVQDTTISTQANNFNITITPSATKNLIVNSNTALKLPVGTTGNRTMTAQGELRFNSTDSVFSGFSTARRTLGGVYSADRLTYARAHPTDNTISFVANSIPTMTVSSSKVVLNGLLVDNNFSIIGNTLAATPINSDLLVNPSSGITVANSIPFQDSSITNTTTSVLTLGATGTGYIKFAGQGGIVIPVGLSSERLINPPVGAFRFNPDNAYAEVYDGNPADGQDGWIPLQGVAATLDATEVEDITNLWALIVG